MVKSSSHLSRLAVSVTFTEPHLFTVQLYSSSAVVRDGGDIARIDASKGSKAGARTLA